MNLDNLTSKIKETPISEIISFYLPLVCKGTTIRALCPFHDDHKPSLHINDKKNFFMCFVDDIGGDAITFVMKYLNMSFVEALREISTKLNISFEDYLHKDKNTHREILARKMITVAMKIYEKQSLHSINFKNFLKMRGLDLKISAQYHLGMATSDNSITQYLHSIKDSQKKKIAFDMAEELGLIKEKRTNQEYYDLFKERIIFPITNTYGQMIGLTSRTLNKKQIPKYMNSINSLLFNKRKILYGFSMAKQAIQEQKECLLVEGNMDHIALWKVGIKNTVAIMGISLGDQALQSLKSLTKKIYLALDNDSAGLIAMKRIDRQFLHHQIISYYVDLAPAKDPDDFLDQFGKIEFQKRIDGSEPFLDRSLREALPESIPTFIDKKLEYLQIFFEILSPLGYTITATERLCFYAEKLELNSHSSQILQSYQNFLNSSNSGEKSLKKSFLPKKILPPVKKKKFKPSTLTKSDKLFLQEIFYHPECFHLKEFNSILDLVSSCEVKDYIFRIKDLLDKFSMEEYLTMTLDYLRKNFFSMELIEFLGSLNYNKRIEKIDKNKISRFVYDLRYKIKEQSLRDEKITLKQRQKKCFNKNENKQIIIKLFEVEKNIVELQRKN